MKLITYLTMSLLCIVSLCSCHKDYLEAKPDRSLMVPTKLEDLTALLNNSRNVMNIAGFHTLFTDGDFRIADNDVPLLSESFRINYLWSDEATPIIGDWDYAYRQVFYSNVVLEGLSKITDVKDSVRIKELKGQALFYRAWAILLISQTFAGTYDSETAGETLGVPYPLSPDVNQPIIRLSLQENFDRILRDLQEAISILPDKAQFLTQPSKVSAYAMQARTLLLMGQYKNALKAAENVLEIQRDLLDYNNIIPSTINRTFPLPLVVENPEILFYTIGNTSFITGNNVFADTSFYNLYTENDLRKKYLFSSDRNYIGSYTGGSTPFAGLATDEVYLIKAECLVRTDEISQALTTLNLFLSKRLEHKTFSEVTSRNKSEILKLILLERRKELTARGIAWMDLKRLNKEPEHQRTLYRTVSGKQLVLEPGSKRYILKLPLDEVQNSGIQQNP